jgi:LysR family glycine cleavage system transcriptional activator
MLERLPCSPSASAILPHFYAHQELAAGRLIVPFNTPSDLKVNYVLTYPPERRGSLLLQSLRQWLLDESWKTPEI